MHSPSVGRDGKVTYPTERLTSCDTATASFCSTTEHLTVTTRPGTTSTSTRTESSCQEFRACGATNFDSTATVTPDNCPLPTARAKRWDDGLEVDSAGAEDHDGPGKLSRRQAPPPPGCPANKVLYPTNPEDTASIRRLLSDNNLEFVEVRAESVGYTAFFRVSLLDAETESELKTRVCDLLLVHYMPPRPPPPAQIKP